MAFRFPGRLSPLPIGFIALAMASAVAHPQSTPPPDAEPLGMRDQPCRSSAFGRTRDELAFAQTAVADGPLDQAVVSAWVTAAPERQLQDEWRQKNDWADLCRYRLENDAAREHGAARIVFIGDSITELWKVADPEMFKNGVVNRGISGQTSGQLLLRFQQDVVALHPQAVHILVGVNDVAGNNGPERPEDLKNNIRAMVDIAKFHHIKVLLGTITPVGAFPLRPAIRPRVQIASLNAWLKGFAATEGESVIDYYAVLAGPDGAMKPGMSRDGVHPLIKGYAAMKPLAETAMANTNR